MMPASDGFAAFLAPRLTKGDRLRVHHTSTPPTECPPLFASGPTTNLATEETWCETHFLAIAQQSHTDEATSGSELLLVLGLEVLIFTTSSLTTIFVSKADSTGFLFRHPVINKRISVAFATTTAFLEYLVQPRLRTTSSRLVLSLFARSQNQYLFPGSIENNSKHILDDRQLIKWWCRVLDPIVRLKTFIDKSDTKAYVVVPGCEKGETRAFFPPTARLDSPTGEKWVNAYPVTFLTHDTSLPPRCLIPRLPDDPKARFLDDLDGAQVDENGSWKGVKSLDQFWEMMSYRQECSAGRLVGFVWATFSTQPQVDSVSPRVSEASIHNVMPYEALANKPEESGPVRPIDDRPSNIDTAGTLSNTVNDAADREKAAPPVVAIPQQPLWWPTSSRGQVILTAGQYSSLMDHLLQLDFAGEETAKASTKEWIDKAKDLAAESDFGVDVEGTYVQPDVPSTNVGATPVANVLTAVRKKRKADPAEPTHTAETPSVNAISVDLIRKKPKA